MPAYRLHTARWSLTDLDPTRRPPTTAPAPTHQPPGQEPGEWEIPRVPRRYDRAVLAAAVVREQPRTTIAAARGPAYDIVAHQQAAMPEQLLPLLGTDPEHDDQEPDAEPRPTIDLTALRP